MSRPQFLWIPLLTLPLVVVGLASAQEPIASLSAYDELIAVLMSESEALAWTLLRTDAERQEFVDQFWEARDPTPGTEANEVRRVFERRAERAARLFAEGDIPGYRTDRGRVMIVFGLPDSQEMRAQPAEGDAELIWMYERGPLEEWPPLNDGTLLKQGVRFDRLGDGYLLSSEVDLDNRMFLASLESELRMQLARAVGGREDAIVELVEESEADEEPAGDYAPQVDAADERGDELVAAIEENSALGDEAEDIGPAPVEVSAEVQVWMQLVFGGISRDELKLRHRLDYFPASDATYTVLSFKVGKEMMMFVSTDDAEADADDAEADADDAEADADDAEADADDAEADADDAEADADDADDQPEGPKARLKLFGAVLQGLPGTEDTIHRFIIPYRLGELEGNDEESPTLSLGVSLYPGDYRLAWGILDETTGNAVTRDEHFRVPDFAVNELTLTRPLMARPPHASDETAIDPRTLYEGMRLGHMVVQDDLDRTFGRDDIVDVILIASGWGSDPGAPGKPRLEVQYRLLAGLEGNRSLAAIPPQVLDFYVLGQQVPLSQVNRLEPGGDYRIEVTVKDLVSGLERVVEAPFRLELAEEDGESE